MFRVVAYRNYSDWSEKVLGDSFEYFDDFRKAVTYARLLHKNRNFYQTMVYGKVYGHSDGVLAVVKGGKVYYILKGLEAMSIRAELRETESLVPDILNHEAYYLEEKGGKININAVDDGCEDHLVFDIFYDGKLKKLQNSINNIISELESHIPKPVKSVFVNNSYNEDMCYVVASSEEKGSVNVGFDCDWI